MTLLLSSLGSIAGCVRPEPEGYAANVAGLPGGAPLAYWRLGEASGTQITDHAGARHGTYAGTVTFGLAGLPQHSDAAVDFGGTGTGEVANDAGLQLSAFSLSFWVKANRLPTEEEATAPILSKDQIGNTAGDFFVSLQTSGALLFRFQTGTAAHDLSTSADLIEPGLPYHVVVRADNTGFDAYVNGQYVGKLTGFTGAWSSNTQPIRFADDPPFALDGNVVLDEIALYSRVITEAEVFKLAQISDAPVASDDSASVPESATTSINVTGNDTFVGSKAALTVTIVSQPGGGDSATVNANNDIDYVAGAVSSDTERSFTYKIEDPLGESNTATVSVNVVDASTPTSDQANPFTINEDDVVVVSSMSALKNAIDAAPPGRTILIAAGTYTGGTLTFDPSGSDADPIVVRPQGARGSVTINSPAWTIAAGSHRLVMCNLYFNNAHIVVRGTHHRFSRCRFRQIGRYCFSPIISESGNPVTGICKDMRIDHCDFSEYVNSGTAKGCIVYYGATLSNNAFQRLLFDYNYVHDISQPSTWTGAPHFVWNTSGGVKHNTGVVYDHCLFDNINVNGTGGPYGHVLLNKISGTKIRFCTFDRYGTTENHYVDQRQGGGIELRSNWFQNMGNIFLFDDRGTHGLEGITPPLVIGNRIIGSDVWVASGNGIPGSTAVPPGQTASGGTKSNYHAAKDAKIIGNIITGGSILIGQTHSSQKPPDFKCDNCNHWDNTGTVTVLDSTLQSGTTNVADNEPYVPAVKIPPPAGNPATDQVGMSAPDPLDPTGPQS